MKLEDGGSIELTQEDIETIAEDIYFSPIRAGKELEKVMIETAKASSVRSYKMCKPEKTVSFYVTRKVNLGNYESIDISCGATDTLLDGESHRDALLRLARDIEPTRNKIVDGILRKEQKNEKQN